MEGSMRGRLEGRKGLGDGRIGRRFRRTVRNLFRSVHYATHLPAVTPYHPSQRATLGHRSSLPAHSPLFAAMCTYLRSYLPIILIR